MADATDKNGNAEALEIPISLLPHDILLQGYVYTLVTLPSLTGSNVSGDVKFSATSTETGDTISYAESNLPAGLSGVPRCPSPGEPPRPAPTTESWSPPPMPMAPCSRAPSPSPSLRTRSAGAAQRRRQLRRRGQPVRQRVRLVPGAPVPGRDHRRVDRHPGRPGDALHPRERHALRRVPVRVRAPGFRLRALRVRPRRRLVHRSAAGRPDPRLVQHRALAAVHPAGQRHAEKRRDGPVRQPGRGRAQLRGGTSPTSWGGSSYTWKDHSGLPG